MTKRQIDWEKIELDYRAGIKTLRQIASEHDVAHSAIAKRAKRDDWSRDLSAKIEKKAEELVNKSLVNTEVNKERLATEKQVIDANAQAILEVRLSHRKDINKAKNLMNALLDELGSQTIERELYERLGEFLRDEDEKGIDKLNDLYQRVISTPSRVQSMQKLADTMKTLITLEREAFNIGKEVEKTADPLTELITTIAKTNKSTFGVVADDPEYEQ
ncbi:hypothetical protein LP109_05445 [Moraxella bovis]|uniref:hypothetical protein n=1 Tax=Moraxella bovis TaxID=476 RepID=UPI0009919479|nr:hypothetical protein [Moraxella bovis]OOR87082.1 hypothetical protein B0182_13220 [Moraxella bovis]UZA17726.1 hypothetical protein LP109_05445 [Moraxella bovis]